MKHWISFVASAGCLAVLMWWTDATEVIARLRGANVTWFLLSLLALTAATCSMARRWQMTAEAFGIRLSYPFALREYYLAQLINTVLPGGVAGDVTRAVRARRYIDLTRAAQSVVAERLLGQIAILGLMFAGFAAAIFLPGGPEWGGLGWVVVMILICCAAVAKFVARRDHATGRFVVVLLQLLRRPFTILHGTITTLCLIFGFYASARAIGVVIPVEAWATMIPLILCAMLIPLSIAGWGWREGAAAALFPIIEAPASAGIATGITYGIAVFVAVLPAAVVLLTQNLFENLSSKRNTDIP